jgi:hypothetical protein
VILSRQVFPEDRFLPPRWGKVRIGVLRRLLKCGYPHPGSSPGQALSPPPLLGRKEPKNSDVKFIHELRCSLLFCAILLTPLVIHAAELPREKVAFAYAAISPSMSGIWMAKEIGAFDRNGLQAELVHISSGATAIQALVGGSVHAALGASNDHRGG